MYFLESLGSFVQCTVFLIGKKKKVVPKEKGLGMMHNLHHAHQLQAKENSSSCNGFTSLSRPLLSFQIVQLKNQNSIQWID